MVQTFGKKHKYTFAEFRISGHSHTDKNYFTKANFVFYNLSV